MSPAVTAIYPGTFDPMTLGHQDIIRRAADLFGTVVVAVAAAHHKKTLFSLDERMTMVREVFHAQPSIRVEPFTGLVVAFARQQGARAMVRGVRSVTDFDFENQLAGMNRSMEPQIDTVFLTPDARYQYLSSTLVREIASLGGDVAAYVDPLVLRALLQKLPASKA